ncbi:MAG: fructosamine kinase family protein [Solirubrobacteraceae bacterium]|nr:fructosamine kinase family protein [Solirubrobacteraceae bacterium]
MAADAIRAALEAKLGLTIDVVSHTAGGDINDAYRAETSGGPIFVKSSPTAQPGMFSDEAAGLEWLGEPGGVATPRVIGVCDDDDAPRLLALEWIESGRLDAAGEEALGRGLAKIHAAGAPEFGATPVLGGGYANAPMRFNELSLPNEPRDTWAEFYAENRLLPLAHASQARGAFDVGDVALIERVAARLPELAGPEEPVARTHGDLWSGNILPAADGTPYLIDPVAHGGHREVDLALLTVFGGPGQRCFDAYDEVFPRAPGHEERKPLWQLAMILLHVYIFGDSYAGQARAIAQKYV